MMMIMISEVWKILYVIGMIIGIGFCAACVLMCVLIGVMVIRACVDYGDEMQARQVREGKRDDGAQLDGESEEKWSDVEEKENEEEPVWLVRAPDGWMKTESQKIYVKVSEGDEQVR